MDLGTIAPINPLTGGTLGFMVDEVVISQGDNEFFAVYSLSPCLLNGIQNRRVLIASYLPCLMSTLMANTSEVKRLN